VHFRVSYATTGEGMPVARAGSKRKSGAPGFGYLDRDGVWAIEPRFEEALPFAGGLAPAREGSLWGYLEMDGSWAIPPVFQRTDPFEGGFARAVTSGESARMLWLDSSGVKRFSRLERVPGRDAYFATIGGWAHPVTGVVHGGREALVDASGMALTPLLREGAHLIDILADAVIVQDGSSWQVMGYDLEPLGPRVDSPFCRAFRDGRSVFWTDGGWGACDERGNVAIQPTLRFLSDFAEGMAFAWVEGERCAVVDRAGRLRAGFAMGGDEKVARAFSGGFSRVIAKFTGVEMHNFLRADGTWLLEAWAHGLDEDFTGGLAIIRTDGSHSLIIDSMGRPRFDRPGVSGIERFGEADFRASTADGLLGLVSPECEWLFEPRFTRLESFCEGLSVASEALTRRPVGLVDKAGRWMWDPSYDEIVPGEDGVFAACAGGGRDRGPGGRRTWMGGTWKLLRGDGSLIRDLGLLQCGPSPLREGRMVCAV
jgi:hypothetical protein